MKAILKTPVEVIQLGSELKSKAGFTVIRGQPGDYKVVFKDAKGEIVKTEVLSPEDFKRLFVIKKEKKAKK